jgi:hypothetical protein
MTMASAKPINWMTLNCEWAQAGCVAGTIRGWLVLGPEARAAGGYID